jgi:hypothetical protein
VRARDHGRDQGRDQDRDDRRDTTGMRRRMTPLLCLTFAAVLAPLGLVMCAVSLPMAREHAGAAHRLLGGAVCTMGGGLVAAAAVFLTMALRGFMLV